MRNVRSLRRISCSPALQPAVCGERCGVSNRAGTLRAVRGSVCRFVAVLMLVSVSGSLSAQDFLFGRSPQGRVPSGSASDVVNTNAQGLGFSVRAGHVAGKDVGRQESLSTLSLSPYVNIGDGLFFGDTRLNYANNGEIAWSAGAGYRHYITSWDAILGGYGYYDSEVRHHNSTAENRHR